VQVSTICANLKRHCIESLQLVIYFTIVPMVDKEFTNITGGRVIIEKYVQIGAGSIVFPDLEIGMGSVVGAMSLVNKSLDSWGIYIGVPARRLKDRKMEMAELANKLISKRL